MGNNFHTPWEDGVTKLKALDLNPALASLDRAISYGKNLIVHCDGDVEWHPAWFALVWTGDIIIAFNGADGNAYINKVLANALVLGPDEFAYVDLVETNLEELTMQAAAVTGDAASNFIAYNRVVLGIRNAVNDKFFPVALRRPWTDSIGS